MKTYIITFDNGGWSDSFDYKKFHNQLTKANGVINWWHYLDSTYIIIANNNVTARNITDFLTKIAPNKKFFVCELQLRNHNGWLSRKAWDWINEQTKKLQ